MSIPPYRYASGEVWGEDPPPTPKVPKRDGGSLRRRAWRARNDPTWAGKAERSKRALTELDRREERR